jgi:energy-coupling factor transporter ATP-binding protein EcfA2
MSITHFSFSNHSENWHLKQVDLDNFNLLVGISGVGKTKILNALEFVSRVATGGDYKLNGETWTIGFSTNGELYEWQFESALIKSNIPYTYGKKIPTIASEQIIKTSGDKTTTLLKRSTTEFQLNNNNIPIFEKQDCAINLLSKVELIKPIYQIFQKFIFSDILQEKHFGTRINPQEPNLTEASESIEQFKEQSTKLPTIVKAYRLQQRYSEEFTKIKNLFTKIFGSVEDIKIEISKNNGGVYEYVFNLKEKTSPKWIAQWEMSSGMFRTIIHLIEISLAPKDSLIIIDELESGLGTNCMPGLTKFLLSKTSHLQVILTSHHPYIINNIPDKTWKIVKRNGGQVTVTPVHDISPIETTSSLDKFLQLLQLPDYQNGIAN